MKKQYNNISLSGSSLCIKRFVFAFMLMAPVLLFAQTWEVPPDRNAQVSPEKFDEQFQKNGAALYKKHCLSCHGEPGKNAPALLTPSPGDLASENVRMQTDGAIFYKITTGKGLMPKFESVLKETERWQIIAYIRTFHKGYVQPELSVIIDDGGKTINITLTVIDKNTLQAKAFSVEQNDTIPAENISLILLMKRYFGNLQVGESKTTNDQGVVFFLLADDLRADTAGNITFIVRPENTELYGDAETISVVETGIKNINPPLNEERALWNTLKKTPLWLLFTYIFGVVGVWSVLGYIVWRLVLLKKSSDE